MGSLSVHGTGGVGEDGKFDMLKVLRYRFLKIALILVRKKIPTTERRDIPWRSMLHSGHFLVSHVTSFPWVVPLRFLGYSIEAIREERVLQAQYLQ